VVITVDVFDEGKGVDLVGVNITSPVLEHFNLTMTHFLDDTYYIYFNSTDKSGIYTYTIWTMDNKDHVNVSSPYVFNVGSVFGNYVEGDQSVSVVDHMRGSNFTMNELGTADSITAYIRSQEDMMPLPKAKAMIYRVNDSVLIGTSEEINPNTGEGPAWKTFYFNSSKPVLENDTEYVLTLWADNACSLYYHNSTMALGRNDSETYDGSPPDPASFTNENRLYSIYCDFTPENTPPEIVNVSDAPNTVGFGGNVTISANVTDDKSGVYNVVVEVLYPDGSQHDLSLSNSVDDTYEYVFTDTGIAGTYEYTVWAYDYYQNENFSTDHSFNVSANATISVCTIKNTYGASEDINITDPPVNNPTNSDVGYELLDDGDVLHIWNVFDSYYFNTSSGIQLTNHYDEYWSHNVLMLGYYNNDQWNLIYRTDELSGFNKDIETDNDTYVNATIWKNLNYNGYDFRLAIRYHLEKNDADLTIIPYIKNLGVMIPFDLGFGWEIKDIKIGNVEENNTILVNSTFYNLSETIDERFTNLTITQPVWNNETQTYENITKPNARYVLYGRNINGAKRDLYLEWNGTQLENKYLLWIKNRTGQYNAPVTLFIKVGTLAVNQVKSTEMRWLDSDNWVSPDTMVPSGFWNNEDNAKDGNTATFASEISGFMADEWLEGRLDSGIECDKVRVWVSEESRGVEHDADRCDIQVYYDAGWTEIATNVTITKLSWKEFAIGSTESVSRMRIQCDDDRWTFRVYEMQFNDTTVLASTTYYFNDYDEEEAWAMNPQKMADGSIAENQYAMDNIVGKVELLNANNCSGTDLGDITKVEIRAYAEYEGLDGDIYLRPVFGGSEDGDNYTLNIGDGPAWSSWQDVTSDYSGSWDSWAKIVKLDCDVEVESLGMFAQVRCYKVEIQVTYTTTHVPEISNPYPPDGSTGISISPMLNITVSDDEQDMLNITWYSNSSGSWQVFGTNNSVEGGTYHQTFSNATVNGQWWYWNVSVNDGTDTVDSSVYKFYTGVQSKIVNTGSTNFSGYLLMQVQFLNESLWEWVVDNDTINETTPRTISASDTLALDLIFNGLVDTSDLTNGDGTYRVYAAFRDEYGDVLVCDDETALEAWYEFEVDTS